MIKLVKTFENYEDVKNAIINFNIDDPWIDESIDETALDDYESTVTFFAEKIASNPPGFFNASYPACATLNLSNSYMTYTHGSIGFGINVEIDKDVKYTLSLIFFNKRNIVVVNPIYVDAIKDGFTEVERNFNNYKNNNN